MKNHLIGDSNCDVNINCPIFILQEMTNSVGFAFSVGDTTHGVYN